MGWGNARSDRVIAFLIGKEDSDVANDEAPKPHFAGVSLVSTHACRP